MNHGTETQGEEDPERISLEARLLTAEVALKEAELRLKQFEIESQGRSGWAGTRVTAAQATLIVAVIGFAGSFVGAYVQGWNAQRLKRYEIETNLILKAVETGDVEVSKGNLKFFLDAGFIDDGTGKIARLVDSPDFSIRLPARMGESLKKAVSSGDFPGVAAEIAKATGLITDFSFEPSPIANNAFAMVKDGRRILVYDPKWLAGLRTTTGTDWAAVFVLAHEMGHHYLGHTLGGPPASGYATAELEADQFAAHTLRRLGASLSEAKSAVDKFVVDNVESAHTPKKADRIAAIEKGWNSASPARAGKK